MNIGNEQQLKDFENKVMSAKGTIIFHKGLILGEKVNIGATCLETGEFCPIWYEEQTPYLDTDGCSFGELD